MEKKDSAPTAVTLSNGGGEANNNSEEDSSLDDFCVYTYRGDRLAADLPSSFFEFCPPSHHAPLTTATSDSPLNSDDNDPHHHDSSSGGSASTVANGHLQGVGYVNGGGEMYSPDMDFLEMDFDPGGIDTDETREETLEDVHEDSGGEELSDSQPREDLRHLRLSSPATPTTHPAVNSSPSSWRKREEAPCCSRTVRVADPPDPVPEARQLSIRLVKSNTLPDMGRRSKSFESPVSAMVVSNSAPLIRNEATGGAGGADNKQSIELEVNGAMIWSWEEAREKSVRQIATSACGATALLNVMMALGLPEVSATTASACVGTRLRANDADLPEYLFSRANAGATHTDLIAGADRASGGLLYARFFQPHPHLSPSTLVKWLLHWICQGAVPVVTLNPQVEAEREEVPDAWHHQMVFGVREEGVCLSNPVEVVPLPVLLPQLTSPSVLLVRRQDVILRKGPRTDLKRLARHPDPRWNHMNVLGQVSNMLLEEMPVFTGSSVAKRVRSTHVSIPAAYRAGVTLFVRRDTPLCQALQAADDHL